MNVVRLVVILQEVDFFPKRLVHWSIAFEDDIFESIMLSDIIVVRDVDSLRNSVCCEGKDLQTREIRCHELFLVQFLLIRHMRQDLLTIVYELAEQL